MIGDIDVPVNRRDVSISLDQSFFHSTLPLAASNAISTAELPSV